MSSSISTPIYFTGLTLQNVRSFGDTQELKLVDAKGNPARWTLVIGENGVGKTTLLQCLTRMQPVFNQPADDDIDDTSNPIEPELASEEKNAVLLDLVRNNGGQTTKLEAHLTCGVSLETNRSQIKARNRISTSAEITMGDFNAIRTVVFGGNPSTDNGISEPLILAYGAGRYPVSPEFVKPTKIELTKSLFEDITTLPDAEFRLYQLDYATSKKQPNAKKILTRLKSILTKLLPDIESPNDIQILGLISPGSDIRQTGIRVKTAYGNVPLAQLSLGYRVIFALIVDIAWNLLNRFPDSEAPFDEPAIVIIDEIDLHLHPQWQRDIRSRLSDCFQNIQFITSSHSPLMAQMMLDANIAVIRRENDSSIIDTQVEAIKEWRLDQVFTSGLFGFPSARHPDVEKKLTRLQLLSYKSEISTRERKELDELDQWIQTLPSAESHEYQKSMNEIRTLLESIASDRNS